MSDQAVQPVESAQKTTFRGSLVRTVVIGLLVVSLIPLIILGTASYLRTRQFMLDQASLQIETLSQNYSYQVAALADTRQQALTELLNQADFNRNLQTILKGTGESGYSSSLRAVNDSLISLISSQVENTFNLIAVVDSSGKVIASSQSLLVGKPLFADNSLQSLYQTDQNQLILNPGDLFPNKLVLLTSKVYKDPANKSNLTLIGFSTPPLLLDLLQNSDGLFPSAHAFFVTSAKQYAAFNPIQKSASEEIFTKSFQDALAQYVSQSGAGAIFRYQAKNDVPVVAYIRNIPELQSTFVLEVPESSIYGQLRTLLPFILALLAVSLVLSSAFIAVGARGIVVPLVELAQHARDFANGDWSYRAPVKRKDEIGLLAYSFNLMVQQLTDFYHSLETRVEERTRQMRLATSVAQDAVAAPSRYEILQRATKLLVEQFNFLFAAIYLVDENNENAILTEQSGRDPEEKLTELKHIPVNQDSVVGWVVANKQSRLEENLPVEKSPQQLETLLPKARSEVAIPILSGESVIGVLDLQSDTPSAFDSESVSIFSSFASQVSAGLRNIQMVDTAASNLQQATFFARSNRLISLARSKEEVTSLITDLFSQTPYVCFYLSVSQDYLQLAALTDPKGTRLDQSLKGYNIPFSSGIARLSEGSPVYISNLTQESEFANLNSYFSRRGCRSAALIPVMEGSILSHVIAFGSREPNPITPLQSQPMLSTAESIGIVLERIRLEQSLTQKNQALSTLNAISNTPVAENTLSVLLSRLHGELQKAVGEDVGFAVALHDPEQGSIQIPYYVDADTVQVDPYPLSDDLLSRTISRNEPTIINEAVSLGIKTIAAPGKVMTTKSFLSVPLLFDEKVIGAMALLDNQKPGRFNDSHLELMSSIALQVGANVHVAQLLTEQYKTIQSYDRELFLFNTLLEHTPDRVEFLNREGRILRLSRAAVDDPFVYSVPQSADAPEEVNADLALMDTGLPVWGQMEKRTLEDGSEKWELISKIPMTNSENQVIGLMIFSRDVTDFKLTQTLAEHRASQLVTAAEIARDTSSGSQDISEMLRRLVELVRDRFGFYHSSIFLLDALGQNAVLRESTGEAGEALKRMGHRLAVGSQSIIGQTTLLGTPVIVNDVLSAENYYPNPLLPETRSEAGIPLINAGQVIGALDVQSERTNAFTEEEVRILLVLADQLAVAIQNAELFTKTESSLLRHRLLHQITAMAGKSSSVDDAIRTAVETLHQVMSRDEITYWSPTTAGKLLVKAYAGLPTLELASTVLSVGERTVGAAASEKRTIRLSEISEGSLYQPIDPDCHSVVCVPVTYQDRLLGVLNVENTEVAAFDETDQEIITTLADNLASIISNIQLVDQVKLQVDRQQQLYDITSKIRRSADIETIMQTSIAEICNAMGIRRASIEITAGDGKSETASSAYQDQTSMDGGVK